MDSVEAMMLLDDATYARFYGVSCISLERFKVILRTVSE
jgi:hypothetical protein